MNRAVLLPSLMVFFFTIFSSFFLVPMRVYYDDVCTALWGGHGYSLAIVSRIFFCSLRGLLPLLSCDKYDSHISGMDGKENLVLSPYK